MRLQAWNAVRDLKVKKALPILEARLARESADFGGNTRHVLKEAIEALKAKPDDAKESTGPTAEQPAQAQIPLLISSVRPPTSRKRPRS